MKRLHLNNIRLRHKLLLIYAVSVFIPIIFTNLVFYSVTTTNVRNQKIRDANIQLEKLQAELQSVIDEGVGIAYTFYTDPDLNEVLDREFTSTIDYVEAYNQYLRNAFARYTQTSRAVKWLEIYTENPTVLPSGGNIQAITREVRDLDWYKAYMNVKVTYPVIISSGGSFSLVQRLDNYPGNNNRGLRILKIDLNMNTVQQIFDNSSFDGKLYCTGADGLVTYSNDLQSDWRSNTVRFADIGRPGKSIHFSLDFNNTSYLHGWTLHGVMNERIVLEEVIKSRTFVIYLACANFVVPTLFLASMSRSINVRLVRILKHMKKVKNQTFEPIPDEIYRDEIGQLTEEFNRMTFRIKSLIDDVYIADIQKKDLELKQQEAQLHALHSQINPHFLFNALETVRMRSLIKNETETARIVQSMAKMFRKSITWSRNWVTVREELELIICFLEIQKYRFGDKLEYEIHVEDAAYDCLIPKMTLVPYVENASIHGVESIPGSGLIQIEARLEQGRLDFSIRDNGIGMSEEKLAEINAYLLDDDEMGERVGMKNAYYRLKMCYGEELIFQIASVRDQGTQVRIGIPSAQIYHTNR